MIVCEGSVSIKVPDSDSVFYNRNQELNRDITIAVLRAFRARYEHVDDYLDAMTASGIRGVRAAADGWSVTMNDWDEESARISRENLSRNNLDATVTNRNANALLHENRFDIVDIDPFGSPIPYIDAAFRGTRFLLCVTATDTAPLCGAHFRAGIRRYGAVPRNTEYHPEMGLRILLSAIARSGAKIDRGISPLLSHVTRHYVRTYLLISERATDADESVDALGYLYHCEDCLHRSTEKGFIPHPPLACQNCDGSRILSAGPLWLASIRDPQFVTETIEHVSDDMGESRAATRILNRLRMELDLPTHFDQHKLCKLWNRPAESMDDFLQKIRDHGFETSRAHYHGTAFKSVATVDEIQKAVGDSSETNE